RLDRIDSLMPVAFSFRARSITIERAKQPPISAGVFMRANCARTPSLVYRIESTLGVLFTLWLALSAASAEDWSQFRGPNGTGVSATVGLPVEFGPQKNVICKTELPPGHSSPVLTRDRIFLTAHSKEKENHKLLVLCLDRQKGTVLWQREVPRTQTGRLQLVNGP